MIAASNSQYQTFKRMMQASMIAGILSNMWEESQGRGYPTEYERQLFASAASKFLRHLIRSGDLPPSQRIRIEDIRRACQDALRR